MKFRERLNFQVKISHYKQTVKISYLKTLEDIERAGF